MFMTASAPNGVLCGSTMGYPPAVMRTLRALPGASRDVYDVDNHIVAAFIDRRCFALNRVYVHAMEIAKRDRSMLEMTRLSS